MKKILLGLISSSCIIFGGCGLLGSSVIEYNDAMVVAAQPAYELYQDYSIYAEETSLAYSQNIEEKRVESLDAFIAAQKEITAMGGYKGDMSLQEAFLSDISTMIASLEGPEADLVQVWIEMGEASDEEWAEREDEFSRREDEAILAINQLLESTESVIETVQTDFAARYGFELEETEAY